MLIDEPQDCLPKEIPENILRKYFLLTDEDLAQVERCRGSANRLGFAAQLCTLRWRSHFLPDTYELPQPVLETLSAQLGMLAMPIASYAHNEKTRWEHMERIRQYLNFSKYNLANQQHMIAHLCTQATITPKTQALMAEACHWLFEKRIVRPGQTTLREAVGTAKQDALEEVYKGIIGSLNTEQQKLLDEMLQTTELPQFWW